MIHCRCSGFVLVVEQNVLPAASLHPQKHLHWLLYILHTSLFIIVVVTETFSESCFLGDGWIRSVVFLYIYISKGENFPFSSHPPFGFQRPIIGKVHTCSRTHTHTLSKAPPQTDINPHTLPCSPIKLAVVKRVPGRQESGSRSVYINPAPKRLIMLHAFPPS